MDRMQARIAQRPDIIDQRRDAGIQALVEKYKGQRAGMTFSLA